MLTAHVLWRGHTCLSEGSISWGSSPLAGEKPEGADMSEEDAYIQWSDGFC